MDGQWVIQVFSGDSSASHSELHARLLRVGSDGSSLEIPVGDWAMDQTHTRTGDSFNYETVDTQSGNVPVSVIPNLITNADQGVLLSKYEALKGWFAEIRSRRDGQAEPELGII